MYKSKGFPHTPKIPNLDLPGSPSPVYTTRPQYDYGSFTAPFPSTVPLRAQTPALRTQTPGAEHMRPRRDSSSSRSHEPTSRMRANSGPSRSLSDKPLKSILKKTAALVNPFRPSSRAEITRTTTPASEPVDYADFAPIPFERRSRSRSRDPTETPAPVPAHHHSTTNQVQPPSVHRSSSKDHSSTRLTTEHSTHHRSSKHGHSSSKHRPSVTSSDSGASSDYEVIKMHRSSNKHHSGRVSRSSGTSSDSGHMSDSAPNFKVKAILNTPDGRHSRALLPHQHGPPPRLFEGHGEEWIVPLKAEAIALNWPLIDLTSLPRQKAVRVRPIYFDVAFDPWHTVSIWSATEQRAKRFFPEHEKLPASTHCVLTEMNIVCDLMDMWPVKVERKKGIRCIDVFDAIHKAYAVPLTEKERMIIGANAIVRCEKAFRQRIKDSPGLPYFHEKQGLLRVDTLINNRVFGGLKQVGQDEWKLILKDPRQT